MKTLCFKLRVHNLNITERSESRKTFPTLSFLGKERFPGAFSMNFRIYERECSMNLCAFGAGVAIEFFSRRTRGDRALRSRWAHTWRSATDRPRHLSSRAPYCPAQSSRKALRSSKLRLCIPEPRSYPMKVSDEACWYSDARRGSSQCIRWPTAGAACSLASIAS